MHTTIKRSSDKPKTKERLPSPEKVVEWIKQASAFNDSQIATLREEIGSHAERTTADIDEATHVARQKDHDDIKEIYETVSINGNNIEKVINPDSPVSFAKIGGIFKLLDKELKKMLGDDKFLILTTRSKGKVIAAYSSQLNAEAYKDMTLELDNDSQWAKDFQKALSEGKVAGSIDGIVHPNFHRRGIMKRLKKEMFETLIKLGITHIIVEIYSIIKARQHGQNKLTVEKIPNTPSTKLHTQKMKARQIGHMKRPTQKLENGWEIEVEATLYSIKLTDAIQALTQEPK